ncbi:MAG: ABC transporter permease [Halobacteriaceae archaeon]
MSTLAITRKDFRDAIRSRTLWALIVLYIGFAVLMAYLPSLLRTGAGEGGDVGALAIILSLLAPSGLLIPLTALAIGHDSIIGEHESGSLKLLLALPHTRREVIFGKILGRGASLSVAVILGFLVSAVVVFFVYSAFTAVNYVIFIVLALVYALVYTEIAVSISALVPSKTWATIAAAGFFIIFEFLWGFVQSIALYIVEGTLSPSITVTQSGPVIHAPNWYRLLGRIPPGSAWSDLTQALLDSGGGSGNVVSYAGGTPIYLTKWGSLLILLLWATIPVAIAIYRFERRDL